MEIPVRSGKERNLSTHRTAKNVLWAVGLVFILQFLNILLDVNLQNPAALPEPILNLAESVLLGPGLAFARTVWAGLTAVVVLSAVYSETRQTRRFRPASGIALFSLPGYAAAQFMEAAQPSLFGGMLSQAMLLLFSASLLLDLILKRMPDRAAFRKPFSLWAMSALGAVFIAEASGAARAAYGLAGACKQWPLCPGLLPPASPEAGLYLLHIAATGAAGLLLAWVLLLAWRSYAGNTAVLTAATLTGTLFCGQILIGALRVPSPQPAALITLHALTSLAVWIALTALVGFSLQEGAALVQTRQCRAAKDFLALTKPLIVFLLLFTTLTGMLMAQKGMPQIGLLFATLLAGAMAAGGSGAINQYIDRDLDVQMARTAKRPIAAGRLFPAEGLAFGMGLLVVSFYIMARFVNLNAALLSLGGMLYYLVVYSLALKRRTAWNIVVGGGAGAIPPLVGWSAASGGLSLFAAGLFVIVFLWTPVHFWALALLREQEYASVNVPMLPVVKGRRRTAQHILLSALLLVGFTWLISLIGPVHLLYQITAVLTGIVLLYLVARLAHDLENQHAHRLYRYSNIYLGVLFLALMLDSIL